MLEGSDGIAMPDQGAAAVLADQAELPVKVSAAAPFIGACKDARKAWHASNLLAQCNPERIIAAREALISADEVAVVALMAEMAGPTATPNLHEAFGPAALRHLETASIVARLIVKDIVKARQPGASLDMQAVKAAMVRWIETGEGVSSSLASISALVISNSAAGDEGGGRARLAFLSPFAISVETLHVVASLSASLIEVMKRTRKDTAKNKIAADAWMRAHPDFAFRAEDAEIPSAKSSCTAAAARITVSAEN